MKITTYFAKVNQRVKLLRCGRIPFSPMSFLLEKINVEDVLKRGVDLLQRDPRFDVRGYLKEIFSKHPRYYLTDDMKRVFGNDRTEDNTYECDITELFLGTLDLQIRREKADPDYFRVLLKKRIHETPEYQAIQEQIKKLGF